MCYVSIRKNLSLEKCLLGVAIMIIKNLQALVLILLLTTEHGMHAAWSGFMNPNVSNAAATADARLDALQENRAKHAKQQEIEGQNAGAVADARLDALQKNRTKHAANTNKSSKTSSSWLGSTPVKETDEQFFTRMWEEKDSIARDRPERTAYKNYDLEPNYVSYPDGKVPTLQELAFNKLKPDLEVMLKNIEDENNFEKINVIQNLPVSSDLMPEFKANFKNKEGFSTLIDAISKNDIEKIKRLIQLDVINQKDNNYNILLHVAAQYNADKVITELLKAGFHVNQKDFFGNTPLHIAVMNNADKVIPLLLDTDANVNQKDKNGNTPLHIAVIKNADKAIPLLLKAGAGINQRDRNDNTPLHIAAMNNADKVTFLLLDAGADVNQRNSDDETPLQIAIRKNADKVIPLLVKAAGADVNRKDIFGETPLQMAVRYNADKVIPLLLKAGADINQTDNRGDTPLHIAAANDADKVISLLLKAGTDINQTDNRGDTPLDTANRHRADKVIPLLRKAGARARETIKINLFE